MKPPEWGGGGERNWERKGTPNTYEGFYFLFACLFVCFETGYCYISQAGLELTMYLSLPSAEIIGMHHHTQQYEFLLKVLKNSKI
jgi:hypothetical protein